MKVVQLLDIFEVMNSCTMIILDQTDDNDMDKYLSKFVMESALIWDFLMAKSLMFSLFLFCR